MLKRVIIAVIFSVSQATAETQEDVIREEIIVPILVLCLAILFFVVFWKCIGRMMRTKQMNARFAESRCVSPVYAIQMSADSDPPPAYQEELPPSYASLFYNVPNIEPRVHKLPI